MNAHDYTEWLGYAAATLTSLSFIPQVWHTLRTHDVKGISVGMYSAFVAGVGLWLVYGLLIRSWPVIVANVITFSLASCILGMKIVIDRAGRLPPAGGSRA